MCFAETTRNRGRAKMLLPSLIVLILLAQSAWAQQKGWEAEWSATLAAAKKEGKVVVANSPDPAMRDISASFKSRFGITVEHLSAGASRIAGRLRSELQAGINTVGGGLSGVQTRPHVLCRDRMLDRRN